MRISHALLALVIPVSLAAQQAAPPANPMTTLFRNRILSFHRNLTAAFDSIPAEKYGYKPTPAQQSVGFVAAHLATDSYFFCNYMGAMKATRSAEDTTVSDSAKAASWSKERLTAQLKESFAFCVKAMDQIDDTKLAEIITYRFGNGPERQVPRVWTLYGHSMDMQDHYAQIANYMRLNGLLPPTAPRPRP